MNILNIVEAWYNYINTIKETFKQASFRSISISHYISQIEIIFVMYVSFLVLFVYVTTVRETMPPQGHLALFFSSLFSFSYTLQMLIIVYTFVLFFKIKNGNE